ncbi:MAG: 50S ribosomal protein L23 [Bacilli bacterium]|nr:50S ribosomal protein L23 [Bacilli bacterium]
MATEKKEAVTKEVKKEAAPKKAEVKPVEKKAKAKKTEVKVDTTKKDIAKATHTDFSVILNPIITEKSMAMIQNSNQATFKVKPSANKAEVKLAFERLFKVKAVHVSIVNVRAKSTSRGGRYQGKIQGYKKAIITIKSGEAIDLFKE